MVYLAQSLCNQRKAAAGLEAIDCMCQANGYMQQAPYPLLMSALMMFAHAIPARTAYA